MANENEIREAAYYIWLNNGCPEGVEIDCWLEAEGEENACECTPCECAPCDCAEKAEKKVKKAPAKKTAAKKAPAKKTAAKK